jgi:hypothetical protein
MTRRSRFGMALLSGFECSVWGKDRQGAEHSAAHAAYFRDSHNSAPQLEHWLAPRFAMATLCPDCAFRIY